MANEDLGIIRGGGGMLYRIWFLLVIWFVLISEAGAREIAFQSEIVQDVYDDRTQVTGRFSILEAFVPKIRGREVAFTPYIQGTYDLDMDTVSKTEAGMTAGVNFLKYLYVSLSSQYVSVSEETSLSEQYVSTNTDKHDIELMTEIGFSCPLPLKILKFSGAVSYIYDIEERRGTRDELTAAIEIGLMPLDLGLRWRHLDTIHGPDTDEIALTFSFLF